MLARRRAVTLVLTMAVQQGCNLSTDPPTGVVLPGTLDDKDSLPIRLAGAVGDFAVAFGGNNPDDGLSQTCVKLGRYRWPALRSECKRHQRLSGRRRIR